MDRCPSIQRLGSAPPFGRLCPYGDTRQHTPPQNQDVDAHSVARFVTISVSPGRCPDSSSRKLRAARDLFLAYGFAWSLLMAWGRRVVNWERPTGRGRPTHQPTNGGRCARPFGRRMREHPGAEADATLERD